MSYFLRETGEYGEMGTYFVCKSPLQLVFRIRSYWIPGSSASLWSTHLHEFLRPLNNKGFQEEIVTKIGLYDLVKSTTLESNKSHLQTRHRSRGQHRPSDQRR